MPDRLAPFLAKTEVGYFSMEIALRNEIRTYSGGLGVLAGDTALSCADLRIPVVFVSLASRAGYLRQEIDQDGRQVDYPDPWDPADWGVPLNAMVGITLESRPVWIRPWLYTLTSPLGGSVPIILLDTDLEENSPQDRGVTERLYGGDEEYRLRQEAVLGIGGVRILRALGFDIRKYHMNEGHSALLTLELLRNHRRVLSEPQGPGSVYEVEPVLQKCIFTTHTPVEAAHDRFGYGTVTNLLGDYIEIDELKHYAGGDVCNMTRLALNLSGYINGVALRHAEITNNQFPGYQVKAITNGVHTSRWTHPAFARLYDKTVPSWSHEPECLIRADQLRDDDVWSAHVEAKKDLISFVQQKTGIRLDPDLALVGFARRMTGYKRPELLFADLDRLKAICRRYPFQVVLAGKAHPHDAAGKRLVEELNGHIRDLRGEVGMAFLPDYDLDTAGRLVSGSDIWLNTPLPPLEASGTSGMKAAVNGVLNFSVLDGWWLEGWIEDVTGWAIGSDRPREDSEHARDLYDKLETKILPLYYGDRANWVRMMKQSIAKLASYFNSHRMMRRYATEAYLP